MSTNYIMVKLLNMVIENGSIAQNPSATGQIPHSNILLIRHFIQWRDSNCKGRHSGSSMCHL